MNTTVRYQPRHLTASPAASPRIPAKRARNPHGDDVAGIIASMACTRCAHTILDEAGLLA